MPQTVQELSCGIIPLVRTPEGVRFLIVKQINGHWSFPKGHVEEGESYKETAARELLEECGVKATIRAERVFEDSYVFSRQDGTIVKKRNLFFLGDVIDVSRLKTQESEVLEARIVGMQEAHQLMDFPSIRKVLKEAAETLAAS